MLHPTSCWYVVQHTANDFRNWVAYPSFIIEDYSIAPRGPGFFEPAALVPKTWIHSTKDVKVTLIVTRDSVTIQSQTTKYTWKLLKDVGVDRVLAFWMQGNNNYVTLA